MEIVYVCGNEFNLNKQKQYSDEIGSMQSPAARRRFVGQGFPFPLIDL